MLAGPHEKLEEASKKIEGITYSTLQNTEQREKLMRRTFKEIKELFKERHPCFSNFTPDLLRKLKGKLIPDSGSGLTLEEIWKKLEEVKLSNSEDGHDFLKETCNNYANTIAETFSCKETELKIIKSMFFKSFAGLLYSQTIELATEKGRLTQLYNLAKNFEKDYVLAYDLSKAEHCSMDEESSEDCPYNWEALIKERVFDGEKNPWNRRQKRNMKWYQGANFLSVGIFNIVDNGDGLSSGMHEYRVVCNDHAIPTVVPLYIFVNTADNKGRVEIPLFDNKYVNCKINIHKVEKSQEELSYFDKCEVDSIKIIKETERKPIQMNIASFKEEITAYYQDKWKDKERRKQFSISSSAFPGILQSLSFLRGLKCFNHNENVVGKLDREANRATMAVLDTLGKPFGVKIPRVCVKYTNCI